MPWLFTIPGHSSPLSRHIGKHQQRVRGLQPPTLRDYERFVRSFLRFSLREDPMDPTRLKPAAVVRFVLSLRDRFSPRSMKRVPTTLRSLFRFLRVQGYADERLEQAIRAVALDLPRLGGHLRVHTGRFEYDQVQVIIGSSVHTRIQAADGRAGCEPGAHRSSRAVSLSVPIDRSSPG
ncbi:MAG: site-specific integrase [Steroidobacteraceae bacterium]